MEYYIVTAIAVIISTYIVVRSYIEQVRFNRKVNRRIRRHSRID